VATEAETAALEKIWGETVGAATRPYEIGSSSVSDGPLTRFRKRTHKFYNRRRERFNSTNFGKWWKSRTYLQLIMLTLISVSIIASFGLNGYNYATSMQDSDPDIVYY
jgi:hypothetical protein